MRREVLAAIAAKEFNDRIRSRWLHLSVLLLLGLGLTTAYFGSTPQGVTGFHGWPVTVAGLISLSIYLVPLLALGLGYDSICGEFEQGTMNILLAYPISRTEIFTGKFLGLAVALMLAVLGGYGLTGLVLFFGSNDPVPWGAGGLFFVSSVFLGLAFLSLSFLVSTMVRERAKAILWVVILWFAGVFIYDLILLGILVLTSGNQALSSDLARALLLGNPADLFRLLNLTLIPNMAAIYGFSAALAERNGPIIYASALLAWVAGPFAIGLGLFQRQRA